LIIVNTSTARDFPEASLERIVYMLFEDPNAFRYKPDASIRRNGENGLVESLNIANAKDGYRVYYLDYARGVWIVVGDRNRLNESVEISDDYFVSVGFIVPKAAARDAVEWFVTRGGMCQSLDWLSDHDMPENACF
jgi:hypothetical protein